jgi:hypothetical protein
MKVIVFYDSPEPRRIATRINRSCIASFQKNIENFVSFNQMVVPVVTDRHVGPFMDAAITDNVSASAYAHSGIVCAEETREIRHFAALYNIAGLDELLSIATA